MKPYDRGLLFVEEAPYGLYSPMQENRMPVVSASTLSLFIAKLIEAGFVLNSVLGKRGIIQVKSGDGSRKPFRMAVDGPLLHFYSQSNAVEWNGLASFLRTLYGKMLRELI